MEKRVSGLSISSRVMPVDINILPSVNSRGTVATISGRELEHLSSPRSADLRAAGSWQNDNTIEEARWSGSKDDVASRPSAFLKKRASFADDEERQYIKDLQQFVRQHFHKKECSSFVPAPKQNVSKIRQLKCHCGAVYLDHAGILTKNGGFNPVGEKYIVDRDLQAIFNSRRLDEPVPTRLPAVKWNPDKLQKTVTNSFGKIKFINVEHAGGNKPAKYIRMTNDDSVNDLFDLMTNYWRIMEPQAPNLVISVVGGAKNFKLDGRNRTTFSTGLIKAAKTTNAWLISSGFNMGVMKSVGQAVQQGQSFCWDNNRMAHVLRCIGIAPWGYVKGRQTMVEQKEGEGKFYAEYRTSNVILHGEPVPLNADHTHYIFVDDGYRNRYGGVAAMRSKIEQKISQPKADGGLGIPVVLVVVEGGTDAIADAKSSLEHRIPVVVCSGTGRAADILAYAYSHTKTTSGGAREMTEKHQNKLKDKIFEAYGKAWKEEEIDEKTEKIKESVQICCQNADLMTVFNMNKHEDLDLAILSVLLKAHNGLDEAQRTTQLRLALTWDRVDIAQEEIFREDVLWRQGSLDDILTEAIVTDKVKFIELILEHGVIMKEYLTLERLDVLYSKVPKHHLIYKLMKKLTRATELKRSNIVNLLSCLLDRFNQLTEGNTLDADVYTLYHGSDDKQMSLPYKHLLIYAVLLHRQNLAKFCWQMGDEPVTSAIAVTRLYGAIARNMTRDESNLRDTVVGYKMEFEKLATEVLDECQRKDPDKAMMIVERKSPTWNEMTCLQIAAASKDQVFLSSQACQNSVSTTWKQGIVSRWWRMIMASLFPPLILWIIEHRNIGTDHLTWYQKMSAFYSSPISKLINSTFAYIVFLLLHSYMVLVDFQPDRVTTLEMICLCWIFTFFMDKIHTFLVFPAPTTRSKLRDWYGLMNYMEYINYIMAFIGFALHFFAFYNATKVLYCLNSVIFIVAITKCYAAFTEVGPKLVMIQRMFGELSLFILVLAVFLLAYGVAHQGLLYHKRSSSWNVLRDVFYYPYWQLYGEIYLEEIDSVETCQNGSEDCKTFHWLVPIILAVYLMIGNILLLNLLIAIFSNVFHQVKNNSQEIWKFQLYFLAMEYDNKTLVVPPFSIFPQLFYAMRWVFRKVCSPRQVVSQTLGRRHLEYLQLFEKEMMTNFLRSSKAKELSSLDTTVKILEKRVDELAKLVEDEVIGDQQTEFLTNFMMTSDGQTLLLKKSESQVDTVYVPRWPQVSDVITKGASDVEVPPQYIGKPMLSRRISSRRRNRLRSESGMFTLPPRQLSASGKNIVVKEQKTEDIPNKSEPPEAVTDVKEAKKKIETAKDSKTDIETVIDLEPANNEENIESDKKELLLSEKELKKIEKAKRKEEKRKQKEEKKARKEKERSEKGANELKKMVIPIGFQQKSINNINDPHGEEESADKFLPSVSFKLDDSTVVKPGDLDSRGKSIQKPSGAVGAEMKTEEENHWNIADYDSEEIAKVPTQSPRFRNSLAPFVDSDDEREFYEEKKGRRRYSAYMDDSSEDDNSTQNKLRKRIQKAKKKKSKKHTRNDSD